MTKLYTNISLGMEFLVLTDLYFFYNDFFKLKMGKYKYYIHIYLLLDKYVIFGENKNSHVDLMQEL